MKAEAGMPSEDSYQPLDRYRQLAEKSPDLISRHRPEDFSFIDVNPAVEKLLGYSAEEIIGRPAYDLFHREDADTWRNRARSVTYREGVYTNVYRFRCKSGDFIWLETTSRTIRDPETGEIEEIICVSRDVSERVQAEHMLTRLARVVEASSDLVMFANEDFHIDYLNEAAIHTMRIDKSRFPSLHLEELLERPEYTRLQEEALPQALERGNWRGELAVRPESMEDRVAVIQQIIAHRNEEGRLEYFSLIGRDITDQQRAQEEARRHQLEMAHVARLMSVGEMASGLAHEINQPLAAIVNYSHGGLRRIEDGSLKSLEEAARLLRLIARQASRAGDIIRRLRGFVRKTGHQRMKFAINGVCEEVAGFLEQDARQAGVHFLFDLDSTNPELSADKVQIEQVVLNLLRNALDAYEDNPRRTREIALCTRARAAELDLRICDQAGGIPAERLERLFEPFYTTKPGGLGMGLAISRTIIETHGGELEVNSERGRGTCFQLRLPLEG